jgi:hypothetical protein
MWPARERSQSESKKPKGGPAEALGLLGDDDRDRRSLLAVCRRPIPCDEPDLLPTRYAPPAPRAADYQTRSCRRYEVESLPGCRRAAAPDDCVAAEEQ